MADYKYTALDRAGKSVTGTLNGRDTGEIAVKLRAMGYYPVEVSTSNGGGRVRPAREVAAISGGLARPNIDSASLTDSAPEAGAGKKVPRVHILLFTRELADLIDAGLPIDRALSVLVEQSDNAALVEMVRKLQGDV